MIKPEDLVANKQLYLLYEKRNDAESALQYLELYVKYSEKTDKENHIKHYIILLEKLQRAKDLEKAYHYFKSNMQTDSLDIIKCKSAEVYFSLASE